MKFQYKHPRIYDFLIRIIYPKKLMIEFSKMVGMNQTVFDVAAGYGRIAKFIDPSNSYYGIDLNKHFVNYGRTQGLELEIKDILLESSYKKSDVFVLVDIIHHLTDEKLKILFDLVFKYAINKVIIIEPAFVNLTSKYGLFGTVVDWIFSKIDDDGINKIDHWFTDEEYMTLFQNQFSSKNGNDFQLIHQKVSNHHLVMYKRNQLL